jgi:hypothetical protein
MEISKDLALCQKQVGLMELSIDLELMGQEQMELPYKTDYWQPLMLLLDYIGNV